MRWMIGGLAILTIAGAAQAASMQEAASPPAQTAEAPTAPAGPQWKIFSRSDRINYLIDLASIRPEGEEVRVMVARVPRAPEAGDLSHVIDEFGVECAAGRTRVVNATEVLEDGETSDTYVTDEPWSDARPGTLDEAVKQLACGEMVPSGAEHASIRAYMDAGRP